MASWWNWSDWQRKNKAQENNLVTSVGLGPGPKPNDISGKASVEVIDL